MSSSDLLSPAVDSHSQSLVASEGPIMPPRCFVSSVDSNENSQTQCNLEGSGETKEFDFLVWHGPSDRGQADRIYAELEGKGLSGYIAERDRVLGQYKLNAMEEAIKNTAYIILLLSKEALSCTEFTRKMHTSVTMKQDRVIPIYIGMRKGEGPRLLNHHVDIQYKDAESLWMRLHNSIARPKKPMENTMDRVLGPSKPFKKDSRPANSSPLPQSRTKAIKVVPGPPKPRPKPDKKSEGRSGWSLFRTRKKEPEEPQDIPLQVVSTKRQNNGAVSH